MAAVPRLSAERWAGWPRIERRQREFEVRVRARLLQNGSRIPAFTLSIRYGPDSLQRFYASPIKLKPSISMEQQMDLAFLALAVALWGVMVLLVAAFRRLERPQGGRP